MSPPSPDRRTRKRLATRQRISDVATRLFIQRGFDQVTVDEIAEAADVARMTVFNHFSRKEDMFFDRDDEAREDLLTALEEKGAGIAPIEALRLFAHQAVAEQRPYARFFEAGSDNFTAAIEASQALRARAGAIRSELTDLLEAALAKSVNRQLPDPAASLAASLLVATWVVAFLEARRLSRENPDAAQTNRAFLALIDQGAKGAKAALEGTPYAE